MLIVPCQTCLKEFLVQINGTDKDKCHCPAVLIRVRRPDLDYLTCNHAGCELSGNLAVGLTLLRAVYGCQSDLYLFAVLEDLDSVTISYG